MKSLKTGIVMLTVVLLAKVAMASIGPATPFRVLWDDKSRQVGIGDEFDISLSIEMPEEYYIYADDTEIDFASLEGLIIEKIDYPEPVKYDDSFVGKTVDVYQGRVKLGISGRVPEGLSPGERDLTVILRFRGCSPTLCYRPEQREIPIKLDVTETAPEVKEVAPRVVERVKSPSGEPGFMNMLKTRDFSVLLEEGTIYAVLIVFLAGILTSLTPCVWPVIPAVLLFVGVHPHKRFYENLLIAASLVAGLVLTYSLLGIAVVAFGKNLGFLYQQKWFLALVVIFFLAMGLSLLGLFEMRIPARWHGFIHKLGGEGYRGAFLAGIGLGLVASPCAGPVLAALLGYVALQGSYIRGFALLLVYGIGMGLIMMLLGAGYGELAGKLKGGRWMIWIKRALGVILLIPAAFYLSVLIGIGEDEHIIGERSGIEWMTDEREALRIASETGRPVMIEFTAAWCPPCRKLEDDFFDRTNIVSLSYMMVPLRVDATVETAKVRRLIEKYRVVGWPTVVFLTPEGKRMRKLRISDYAPEDLEESMKEAICRAKGIERGEPECKAVEEGGSQ